MTGDVRYFIYDGIPGTLGQSQFDEAMLAALHEPPDLAALFTRAGDVRVDLIPGGYLDVMCPAWRNESWQ